MTKCYSVNGPRGLVEETVTIVLTKNTVVGYVPIKAESRLKIQPILGIHAGAAITHLVEMPMRRPYDASKNNHVLRKRGMTLETMA